MHLNLGCGPVHAAGWTNVDGSNRAWLASRLTWLDRLLVAARLLPPTEFSAKTVYANLLRPFPWGDQSAASIYMGEILEHFTKTDGEWILRECYRTLKPGGLLRIRVPDHARFWQNYVSEFERAKERPRTEWSLEHTRWTAMYFRDICVRRPKLWQSMGHFHKWMYDEISLIMLLETVGFQRVSRKAFHDSDIPRIDAVEVRDDLIVEATRP
jgi:predicted SAM-dependent methyltransferase